MAHNGYYQQQQQQQQPTQAQQGQYQYYQQPQNIYQQLGKPQPQPHLQQHAMYTGQQAAAGYQQQQHYPAPQQYAQPQFQPAPQPQRPQSTAFVAPPPQPAYIYPARSPQPPLQQQTPAPAPPPPATSYPTRPASSFIPTASYSFPAQQPQPPPQSSAAPLSRSRPPLSPSALLAEQQTRIEQAKQAAAGRTTVPSSSSFAAAQSVFGGGVNNAPAPQAPGRRPLPQPTGNTSAKPPAPPSVGLSRSTTLSRPLSMPPPISMSMSTGAAPLGPQHVDNTPSPTKSRPLPGTPGESSNSVSGTRISGLPVTESTFGGSGYTQSPTDINHERSRLPSPSKQQQYQQSGNSGSGPPQLPPLNLSSSSAADGGLSRTTSMAAGHLNNNSVNRPFNNDTTPKRRPSPPRFAAANSPTKEISNARWATSSNPPLSANPYSGAGQGKASGDPSHTQSQNQLLEKPAPASSTVSSSASSTTSPKKFTPMWKRTLPDYPAPVFGYAAGMVSDPFGKPPPSVTPSASTVTPPSKASFKPSSTSSGKSKIVKATTPTGNIKIRGIEEGSGSGGSPSMLPYMHPTPPKGFGTPPQGVQGHGQSGMSSVYNSEQSHGRQSSQQGQAQHQPIQRGRQQQQMYEESTEDDSDDSDSDDDDEDPNAAYQYEGSEDYSSEEPPVKSQAKSKQGSSKTVPVKSKTKGQLEMEREREREKEKEKGRAKAAARQQAVGGDYPDQRERQNERRKGRSLKDRYEEEDEDEDEDEEEEEEEEERYPRKSHRKHHSQPQYEDKYDYDNTPTKHSKSASSNSGKTRTKLIKSKPVKMKLRDHESEAAHRSPMHRTRGGSESDGFVVVDTDSPARKGRSKTHARHQSQRSELDDWEQLEWEQQQRQRGHVREKSGGRRGYVEEEEDEEEDEEEEDGEERRTYEEERQAAVKTNRRRSIHRREAESHGYEEESGGWRREREKTRSGPGAGHQRERADRYEEFNRDYQQQQQRRAQSQHRSSYQDEDDEDAYYRQQRQSKHGSPVKFPSSPHSQSPTKPSSSSQTKTMRMAEMWVDEQRSGGNGSNMYATATGTSSPTKEKGVSGGMAYSQPPLPHRPSQNAHGHFAGNSSNSQHPSPNPNPNPDNGQRQSGGRREGYDQVERRSHMRDASRDSNSSRRTAGSSASSVLSRSEFPPPPTHPSSPRPYLRLGLRERKSWYGDGSDYGDQPSEDGDGRSGYAQQQQEKQQQEQQQTPRGRGLPKPPVTPNVNVNQEQESSPRKLVKKSRPVSSGPPTASSPTKGGGYGYGHNAQSEAESLHDEQGAMRKGVGSSVKAIASKFTGFSGTRQPPQQMQQPQPQPQPQQPQQSQPLVQQRKGSRKLPPTPTSQGQGQGQRPPNVPPPPPRVQGSEYGGSGYASGYASAPSPAPSSTSSTTSSVRPPLPARPNPSPVLSRFNARNVASQPSGSSVGGYGPQQHHHTGSSGGVQMHGTGSSGMAMVRGEVGRGRMPLKGGYDALDEPPPRSLRTPSPAPSTVSAATTVGSNYTGYQQQEPYSQHKRGQSMHSNTSQHQHHQQAQPRSRPQSQIYGSTVGSNYAASSGSFSPASTELSMSLPQPPQEPQMRKSPFPEFRQREDIQCPAPVGGREKMANLVKMEEEEEKMRREERIRNQHQQQQSQQNSSNAAPPIPQINFDFVDSGSNGRQKGSGPPSVPSIQINVDGGSPPTSNPSIPAISFGNFDSGVPSIAINEPQQQHPPPQVTVFEIPGVSVSGPQFEDNHSQPPPTHRQGGNNNPRNPSRAGRKTGGLICAGCEGPIIGRIVAAMNVRWHPQCFRCTVCQTLLEHVSSYEHDGRPYCHLDYHENFAPKCYSCKTSIIEEQFISLDDPSLGKRTYHMEHFFCAECGDPFMTPSMSRSAKGGELALSGDGDFEGFTVYKGHPYCESCHVRLRLPKCKKCKKSIRDHDRAVEALGGKWCWTCFVCEGCNKPFEDPSFFQRDNHPYCESCFSIILRNEI